MTNSNYMLVAMDPMARFLLIPHQDVSLFQNRILQR